MNQSTLTRTTMNRRQLLQGTGVLVAAAAMSPLLQSPAFAAPAQGLTAYGASVCAGLGLGSPRKTPPNSTWFDQTALALGLRLPGMANPTNAINGAVPGTSLKGSLEEQAAHPERSTWGQFFWGGHAEVSKGAGYSVVGNLRKMARKYPGSPYLILGITNGKVGGIDGGVPSAYYTEAIAPGGINDQLAEEHGVRFFDVQAFLADPGPNGALARSGITPTAADKLAFDEKRVPPSLRPEKSQVHLNLIGQTRVAEKTTAHLRANNWFTA